MLVRGEQLFSMVSGFRLLTFIYPSSSGGKAWNQALAQPITEPSPPTGVKGMSFLAIQHSQQARVAPPKDKRSLREIQEEEHALQAEADFLIWWTAEEERVQQEALALEFQSKSPPPPPSGARKPSRTKHKKEKDRSDGTTKTSAGSSAGAGAGSGSGQASTMQRVPSSSGVGQSTAQPTMATESRVNHSPRKQPRKPRTADS